MIKSAKYLTAQTHNHVADAIPTTQADQIITVVNLDAGHAAVKITSLATVQTDSAKPVEPKDTTPGANLVPSEDD